MREKRADEEYNTAPACARKTRRCYMTETADRLPFAHSDIYNPLVLKFPKTL